MPVEFLLVLLFLLFLLAGVTVVGHGLWLIAAAFVRACTGHYPTPERQHGDERQCQFQDFLAFRRVLGSFRDRGWVSPDAARKLFQLCRRGEEELAAAERPPLAESRAAKSQSPGEWLVTAAQNARRSPKPVAEREWVQARLIPQSAVPQSAEPTAAPAKVHPAAHSRSAPPSHSALPSHSAPPSHSALPNNSALPSTPVPPSVVLAPPRRAVSEVLQSFLAAHNIRWGELVAGILIVVCSIGLVISLWNTITATHRLLPAAVFLLAAAGIEGAGLYTLRRWKLRHTSRVVLIIGTMLIPLSMMAGISVAGSGPAAVSLTAPSTWMAIATGWLVCGGLIYFGGRALVRRPADRWWTLAVGLPTILLPLVPAATRYFGDSAAWVLLAASSAVAAAILFDAHRRKSIAGGAQPRRLGPGAVQRRTLLAGIGVYALAVLTAMFVLRLGTAREIVLSLGLSWIPTFAALAAAAVSIRAAATTGAHRIVGVAVAAVAGVATAALFPPTLASFGWSSLYTLLVVVSAVVAGWRMRAAAVVAAAAVALGLFAPLAAVHWIGGIAWAEELPLWRRYISGESMLSLFAVAALLLPLTRSRAVVERFGRAGQRLLGAVAITLVAGALGIGLVIGLGPSAWLGILPRFIVVGLLALMALALAVTQAPRRQTVNLVSFAVLAAWAAALVPMDVWRGQPMAVWLSPLTVVVLGSAVAIGLLGEVSRTRWRKSFSGRIEKDSASPRGFGVRVLGWWWDAAAELALIGGVLAAVLFVTHDRSQGVLAAGLASVVLLVAAVRSQKPHWLAAGQCVSFVAAAFAAVWFRPAWFLPLSAWTTTDALFASVAVAGGVAASWAGLRRLAAMGPGSIARVLQRDRLLVDAHLARLGIAGWTLGTVVVLLRLFGGHARSLPPLLPSAACLLTAMILTGISVGAWWWHATGARRRPALAPSEWSLSTTIVGLTAALMLTVLGCGAGAVGVAAVGWSTVALASLGAIGIWWLGRRATDAARGELLRQLRAVSGIALLTLSGASVSLIVGLGEASFFFSSPAAMHRWTIGTLVAWGFCGTIVLAILSRWFHSPAAAYLAGLLTPATAALAWRLLDRSAVGQEWMAIAVATTLVSDLIVRRLDRVGATARLDAAAWPTPVSNPADSLRASGKSSAVWQIAVGGIVSTLVVAVVAILLAWIGEAQALRTVVLWSGTYLLAGGLIMGRAGSFRIAREDAGLGLVVLGSGLAAALCVSRGWLPADRGWVAITTIWVLSTAGFGTLGIVRAHSLLVSCSLALSAAVAVAAAVHVDSNRESVWLWLAATVIASGLALAAYVRFPWPVAAQWIAAAATASGLGLLVWWVPEAYLLTAAMLVLASLAMLWRTVPWLAGSGLAGSALAGSALAGKHQPTAPGLSNRLVSPAIASGFTAVTLIAASLLVTLVFAQLYGNGGRLGEWRMAMSVLSLAMLIVTTPLSVGRLGGLSSGFVATQLLVALGVAGMWQEGIPASPLAVVVMAGMLVSGVWVWGWPLRRQLRSFRHSFDPRATRELVAMLLAATGIVLGIAALAIIGGVEANSRWLMIGSLAGYGWLLAIAAGWSDPLGPWESEGAERSGEPERSGGAEQGGWLRTLSVLVFTAALLLTAAGLDPGTRPWGLIVVMRMLVAGVVLVPIMVWGAPRLLVLDTVRWGGALRIGALVGGIVAASSLGLMLVLEWQLRGSVLAAAVPLPLVIGIAILLVGWSATLAVIGIRPSSTSGVLPAISDTDRRWLLRAAQGVGAIAWLHVFLCRPDLALVGLRPYWPYLVLALAFLSAGITEWGRRRGDAVVGDTMRQTTLFLPLIPAIGFWLSAGRSEWVFVGGAVSYAWLLLLAAALYGGLAVVWRRDLVPRVASIVLANLALWVVLAQSPSFSFLAHPQLWLIPPAVCVLFAAHLERQRLDPRTLAAIRYAATLVIYVSSTADVLLGEIGRELHGPIILIVLALAGMAAGAVLRTRAFLYLGTLFVIVGVLSMVWHAQQAIDQVWPWWVFGITTGVLLLVGLMAIEKNKPKIRHWADALATWES
ncbi:hypothetical protein [Candidatus Laterigemmans baculatus]|uniref:hypothetical protein n=1 Tax=Candidatus Laterigemmans baculatus TaxID=2770505 RepID=UPI0013DA3908|nr:hypothetical protein [Candidatus Laterigemmans baculatus]